VCYSPVNHSSVTSRCSTRDPAQYDDRQAVEKSSDFKTALQQRPLRFAFIDGTVETVCPDPAEKTWVLNIKKGVISAIQNTMTSLTDSTTTTEVLARLLSNAA
jgi:hypothetical protein